MYRLHVYHAGNYYTWFEFACVCNRTTSGKFHSGREIRLSIGLSFLWIPSLQSFKVILQLDVKYEAKICSFGVEWPSITVYLDMLGVVINFSYALRLDSIWIMLDNLHSSNPVPTKAPWNCTVLRGIHLG